MSRELVTRNPRNRRINDENNKNYISITNTTHYGIYVGVNIKNDIYGEEGYFNFLTPYHNEKSKSEYGNFLRDIQNNEDSNYKIVHSSTLGFGQDFETIFDYNAETNKILFTLKCYNLMLSANSIFKVSATIDDDLWEGFLELYAEKW